MNQYIKLMSLIFLVTSTYTYSADQLALAQSPLSVSAGAKPNVMLLVDTSGSMNTLVVSDTFNATDTSSQDVWQYWYNGGWSNIANNGGDYQYKYIWSGGCGSGYKLFQKTSTSAQSCVKLPAPVGSDTRITGPYLNFLLNNYSGNIDYFAQTNSAIPYKTRLMDAQTAAKALVNDVYGKVRLGIAKFYGPSSIGSAHGASIPVFCDSVMSKNEINATIDTFEAESNTPLAEAMYEITRYFRGLPSFYNGADNQGVFTSPIQYRCQKNFTIVITDGQPTNDQTFPGNDPADIADTSKALPNWDGTGSNVNYVRDIAKFAWDIDMKTTGVDLDGKSYNAPGFEKQNGYTYTVGFALQNQTLEDAATNGHGEFYRADNIAQLTLALNSAIEDILAKSGTSAAAAASTGSIQAGTKLYQARFNSVDWSGGLLAYDIDTDRLSPTYGKIKKNSARPDGAKWDAADKIPGWSTRKILTNTLDSNNVMKGVRFRWSQFTPAEQQSYFDGEQPMLQYLRGKDVNTYRSRIKKLGDIVNSSPAYVGKPSMSYPIGLESSSYAQFVSDNASRTEMVYVGANDGMLHGFDANTGVEKMAYIPGSLLPKLKRLSDPNYGHRFYVDGSPTIVDAYINNQWRTVLIGGLNAGGQSVYALDVTSPNVFNDLTLNADKVFLWEFTNPDLGYSYSQPKVIKLKDDKWYVVFGSGYNNTEADGTASSDGKGRIFIVNLETGALAYTLSTDKGFVDDPTVKSRPNGISDITPVDYNQDFITDAIYTGDLFGNVWKFDLTNLATITKTHLFEACSGSACSATTVQPITTAVLVGPAPSGKGEAMVYAGTGKYLETGDNSGSLGGIQSVYGFYDDTAISASYPLHRSDLTMQSITHEVSQNFVDDKGTADTSDDEVHPQVLRVSSKHAIGSGKKGWFIDLVPPSNLTGEGERIVSNMTLRRRRLIFQSSIPFNDTCVPGGDLWFFDFDARRGSPLKHSPFDNNNDRNFSSDDYVQTDPNDSTSARPATARKVPGGGVSTKLTIIHNENPGVEGVAPCTQEAFDGSLNQVSGHCGDGLGRQRWEQLYR